MAVTNYSTNDPLAVKLWSKKLAVEALKATYFQKFIGDDDTALVQRKMETEKGPGDKITYGLRMQLNGGGVQGDGTVEGNEEALVTYTDALLINQLRHSVRSNGRMSQQRVPYNIRQECLNGLVDWWADRMDQSFFNQICGYVPATDTRYTGNNAVIPPDSSHYWNIVKSADDTGLGAGNVFSLAAIDKFVELARVLTPPNVPIRPLKIGGKDWYVGFLHPYQVTDLRTASTAAGSWYDIQKSAMTGGLVKDNPIFDGALGVYNGVILHEDFRVTPGYSPATSASISTVRRAVFCGAQAAMLAFGQDNKPEKFTWVEELFDYENQFGVAAGTVFGLKKTQFNSADFGTLVTSSYAVAH